MNNPVSSKPEHALFPYPPGCTGHRVLEMLRLRRPNVTRQQYLAAFDRRNLVAGKVWDKREAQRAADTFRKDSGNRGRVVLVFGEEPRKALGLEKLLVHPQRDLLCDITWRQLPHPSGRCYWYNEPECRELAADLLAELYDMGATSDAGHQGSQRQHHLEACGGHDAESGSAQ
jgi:hypothetical protein